jgi:hypothetical protein
MQAVNERTRTALTNPSKKILYFQDFAGRRGMLLEGRMVPGKGIEPSTN